MKKMLFLFFAALSIGCSSQADDLKWVDVTNVASSDSLSVRSEANVSSVKKGEFKYDQKMIRVTGSENKKGKSTWLPVRAGNIEGWVNKRFVKASVLKIFQEPLKCLGTEPFWSIDISDGEAKYSEFNELVNSFAITNITLSNNHNNAWLLRLVSDNVNSNVQVQVKKSGVCSDDMSDTFYHYEIGLELPNGKFVTGCCNRIEK